MVFRILHASIEQKLVVKILSSTTFYKCDMFFKYADA